MHIVVAFAGAVEFREAIQHSRAQGQGWGMVRKGDGAPVHALGRSLGQGETGKPKEGQREQDEPVTMHVRCILPVSQSVSQLN